MILHLENEKDFEKEISEKMVLVDFYADWCGPCQMLAPVLEELDKAISIKIVKVNVDDIPELARQFRVMSIPTLLLFKEGKLTNKSLGYMPLESLKEFVK